MVRGGSGLKSLLLTNKLSSIGITLQRKSHFFNRILLEILTALRTVHMFSSRGTIQSEQNHIFIVFFDFMFFWGRNFLFIRVLLIHYGFQWVLVLFFICAFLVFLFVLHLKCFLFLALIASLLFVCCFLKRKILKKIQVLKFQVLKKWGGSGRTQEEGIHCMKFYFQ